MGATMGDAEIVSLRMKARDRLELAEKIHDGLSSAKVRQFLKFTGLTQEQLFQAAHIAASTGRKRLATASFPDHESERIARIARVFDRTLELFPDPSRAVAWLVEKNPRLAGRRPLDAAGTELGAMEVEALIGRLAHGVF